MSEQHKERFVRVAMIKAVSELGDVEGNLRLLEELARPLEGRGVDVLITPECFLDGYMVQNRKTAEDEERTRRALPGCCVSGPEDPAIQRAGRLAERLGSYVVVGASEKDAGGAIRNAAYLLGRDGAEVGTYHKVMPCRFYEPGDALPVFETDFGLVGVVICADRRWPENARTLRIKGAELILNPTWGFRGDLNTAIMRTRAYENGIPICFTHPRQSLICGPSGEVAALLESSEPGALVHDLDLSQNVTSQNSPDRASSHPARNRRPELWGAMLESG